MASILANQILIVRFDQNRPWLGDDVIDDGCSQEGLWVMGVWTKGLWVLWFGALGISGCNLKWDHMIRVLKRVQLGFGSCSVEVVLGLYVAWAQGKDLMVVGCMGWWSWRLGFRAGYKIVMKALCWWRSLTIMMSRMESLKRVWIT